MEKLETFHALTLAHGALLRALAETHPDPVKLLQTYLKYVNSALDYYPQLGHSPEFVAFFRKCAEQCTEWIPAG